MDFWKRRKRTSHAARIINPTTLKRLPDIGRQAFADPPEFVEVSEFYLPGFQAAGNPIESPDWDNFVDQFVSELSESATSQGGWAIAGAFHVAKDFVKSDDWIKPKLVALMDNALVFLADEGVPAHSLPMFALRRYEEIRQRQ